MQWIGIIGVSIAFCVAYGIVHDQITARICVEYFTIGHPPVFRTQDPTMLGIGWGVIATWWVGAILGVPLSIAARFGRNPKRTVRQMILPMLVLMLCSAVLALGAGVVGFYAAYNGWVFLVGEIAEKVPRDRHIYFITDLWAHSASYLSGFIGGIILIVSTWRTRNSSAMQKKTEQSDADEGLDRAFLTSVESTPRPR
jgi:hypothetical protein